MLWRCAALVLALAALPVGAVARAQNAGQRLIDRDPFDRLTLTEANESKVLLLRPVDLPDRLVPEMPRPSDKLRVRLLEDGQEYEVTWVNIARLELFEQMVLAEANRLAAEGKLDAAYEYFDYLFDRYPNTPGLAQGQQTYLYLSSAAAFRQQKYDEALAIVEELLAQNPQYRASENAPALMTVLGNIADKLVAGYLAKEDYRSARTLLSRLAQQHNAADEPFVVRLRGQLSDRAEALRNQARAYLEAGDFLQAYDACSAMEAIWPEVAGGAELRADVARRYPLVRVGVDHPALEFDARSIANPAARRAGRLVERGLLEFAGPGPEGGKYTSPLGTVDQSVDGLQLVFNIRPGAPRSGYDVAQLLLSWASPENPHFQPAWTRSLSRVRVVDVRRVIADLASPHVLAPALLQGSYDPVVGVGEPDVRGSGPFFLFSRDETLARYSANDRLGPLPPGQLAEIDERVYDDPARAILALQRGEIDVLDNVFPGDLPLLSGESQIAVAPRVMPTTHLIVFREGNPFLGSRTFRRALLYGLNRSLILEQGILKGHSLPGFRVISAPFPAPAASSQSQSYGYDQLIQPLAYDPRLALTLRVLAQAELKSSHEKLQKPVPALSELVLGHPADETSRIACRAIKRQWDEIGIKCKLAELPPGTFDDQGVCDMIYVQAATWEPIVDAGRLLGPEGIAPAQSAFVQLTLRQIERTTSWQDTRDRFRQLHRLLHEDVTVLPLWQTFDHYAYRRPLVGLESPRSTLYENVEAWRAAENLAQAAASRPQEATP
jgi:ABC-type transport system substrate-binding protein